MTLTLTIPEILGALGLAVLVWRLVVSRIDSAKTAITTEIKEAKGDLEKRIDRVESDVRTLSNNVSFMAGQRAGRADDPVAHTGAPYTDRHLN